jgi:hypothetical protein
MSSTWNPGNNTATEGDLTGNIIACAVVMPVLASSFIGLRFYIRGRILRAVKIEDWCILVALVRLPNALTIPLKPERGLTEMRPSLGFLSSLLRFHHKR